MRGIPVETLSRCWFHVTFSTLGADMPLGFYTAVKTWMHATEAIIEGFVVKGSESFIEEERVYTHIPAGHVRETERQGEAYNETFAAGEIFCGSYLGSLSSFSEPLKPGTSKFRVLRWPKTPSSLK